MFLTIKDDTDSHESPGFRCFNITIATNGVLIDTIHKLLSDQRARRSAKTITYSTCCVEKLLSIHSLSLSKSIFELKKNKPRKSLIEENIPKQILFRENIPKIHQNLKFSRLKISFRSDDTCNLNTIESHLVQSKCSK